ncbi:MAG: 4-(cytidine 5'-diphospho)-2-C-methyl-D-erythritol kinase [Sphingomicrobium sp.]
MILRDTAYAKLNLALHVRGKLPDGRHRLETIFAFGEDGDELTAEAADEIGLSVDGPFAAALDGDNLVLRAAKELQDAADVPAGARLHLTKKLPVASGIGGGSADAGAALRLLTILWGVEARHAERVAPVLGSDVPACLRSLGCRGTAGGEELEPLDLGLTGTPLLLVNPRVQLSTAKVFAAWDGTDRGPLERWSEGRNDLEAPATRLVPQVGEVLQWLRSCAGAEFVHMSGSGATCFALFRDDSARDVAAEAVPRAWWHLATRLR